MHIVPKNSLLAPSGAEILRGGGGIRPPNATHNNQGVGMERVNFHTSLWIENCCEGQVKWLCTDYDIDFYISKIVEKSYRDKYMTDYSSLCYK